MIINIESENKNAIVELAERYGVKNMVVSTYHLQVNGMIEHDHKPINDILLKMSAGGFTNWVQNLLVVL